MARITYVEFDGTEHAVEVATDMTVMQGAQFNGIPGIDATCGGMCACATCHVFVDSAWVEIVGDANPEEADMLDFADSRQPNSRLSCQIQVREHLDGLIVRMPENQQ